MRHLPRLLSAGLLLLVACGTDQETAGPCSASLQAGNLVITELMVNPAGGDAAGEWIEIYNATLVPQCLNGVFLEVAGAAVVQGNLAGNGDDLYILPGSYAVIGGFAMSARLTGWGDTELLVEDDAALYLKLGDRVIDRMTYSGPDSGGPREGQAYALCSECLDSDCNDQGQQWFVVDSGSYDDVNTGSPGTPNGDCACPAPPGHTVVRTPAPGDLVISEIFANPYGIDGDREWFEVRIVAQDAALDFARIEVRGSVDGPPVAKIPAASCLIAEPDSYMLFARSGDKSVNGGVTPNFVYGTGLTLSNDGGYVGLVMDGELIAGRAFGPSSDGKSQQLDPDSMEWCESGVPLTEHDFATPATKNGACGVVTCLVGGNPEPAQIPVVGELEIVEVFPNTPGQEVPVQEWFELRVSGSRAIDLNTIEIFSDPFAPLAVDVIQPVTASCLRVQPGGHVLLARSALAQESGLPVGSIIHVYPGMTMKASGYLALRHGSKVLSEITWEDVPDGRSWQKDPGEDKWCAGASEYWTTPENKIAFGTPGSPNDACDTIAVCQQDGQTVPLSAPAPGQLVINELFPSPSGTDEDAREWLELYAADGSLGKHLNGLELIVKGESLGIIGGNSETCIPIEDNLVVLGRSDDAGENGGVAVDIMLPGFALPNTDVSVILSKGATVYDFAYYDGPTDGVAVQLDPEWLSVDYNDNPENWCDSKIAYNETPELGTPGDGNPSCTAEFCMENGVAAALKQFYPDQLVITEVYANPDGADGKKEWFEIFVEPDASPAHLNGLGILKSVGEEPDYIFSTMQCLELSPGEHYVLCRSADPEENGGLTDCIEYGSVTLVNSNGVLGLGKPGLLVDLVPSYGTAADGISRSLDPEYYSASGNDSKDHWCNTPDSNKFSDGVGTPGKVNPSCD